MSMKAYVLLMDEFRFMEHEQVNIIGMLNKLNDACQVSGSMLCGNSGIAKVKFSQKLQADISNAGFHIRPESVPILVLQYDQPFGDPASIFGLFDRAVTKAADWSDEELYVIQRLSTINWYSIVSDDDYVDGIDYEILPV